MQTADFRRAYDAFVAKRRRNSKGTEALDRAHFDWPFFDATHRALGADADRWAIGAVQRLKVEAESRRSNGDAASGSTIRANVDAACRAPRRFARRSRPAAALRPGALRRCFARASIRERCAWCARRSPGTTASPISRSRCRDSAAGPIALAVEAGDHPAAALARRSGARPGNRGVRAVRAGRGLRCRGDDDRAPCATAATGSSTAARRGSPTAASPISTACSCARATSRARAESRRSSFRPTRRV